MQKLKEILAFVLALTIAILPICSVGADSELYGVYYSSDIYTDTGELIETLWCEDVFEDYYMNTLDTNPYWSGDTVVIQQKPFYRYPVIISDGHMTQKPDAPVESVRTDLTFLGYDAYKVTTTGPAIYVGRYQPGDTLQIDDALLNFVGVYHKDTLPEDDVTIIVSGNYTYKLTNEGNAIITKYDGSSNGDVIVPSMLDGHTVTDIESGTFTNLAISTPLLVIPDNVKVHEFAIRNYAPKMIKLGTGVQFSDTNPVFGVLGFPRYLENAYAMGNTGFYMQKRISGDHTDWLKCYTISYARNDGSGYIHTDTSYYVNGDTVALFTPQDRTGYDFIGYLTTSTYNVGDVIYTNTYTMPSSDVMLYALWVAKDGGTYTVTYTADGADTGCTAPVDSTQYNSGDTVTVNNGAGLTKQDYILDCWVDELGNDISLGSTFVITSSKALYPRWVKANYHVTYHTSGSTSGSQQDSAIYKKGDTVTIKDAGTMQKTGYSLVCWLQKDSQNPYQLDANSIITPSDDGTDLYIDNGGALAAVAKTTVTTYVPAETTTITDDIDLYPVWQIKPPIFYDANGGLGTAPVDTDTYPGTWDAATVKGKGGLYRLGYTFIGWSKTPDNSSNRIYQPGATLLATALKGTLYAQWQKIDVKYSVSYTDTLATSGTAPVDTNQYAEGGPINIKGNEGNLQRDGYTFGGWADETNTQYAIGLGSMPGNSLVLHPIWIANPVTPPVVVPDKTETVTYLKGVTAREVNIPVEAKKYAEGDSFFVKGIEGINPNCFVGWYCTELNKIIQPNAKLAMIKGGLTFVGRWLTINVTYQSGLSIVPAPAKTKEYESGIDFEVLSPILTATSDADYNYTFSHWLVDKAKDKLGTDITVMPNDKYTADMTDITFVGIWDKMQITKPTEPATPTEPTTPSEPSTPSTPEPSTPVAPTEQPEAPKTAEPTNVTPAEPTVAEPTEKPIVYGTVHGVVTGPDGEVLEGIRVELHSVVRFTYTDKKGKYSFDNVDLGNHKVILKDPDTLKVLNIEKIVVKEDTQNEQEYTVTNGNTEVSKFIELSEDKAEKQIDFVLKGYKKAEVTPVADKKVVKPAKVVDTAINTQPQPEVVQPTVSTEPEQVEPTKDEVKPEPVTPTDELKPTVTPDKPEPVKPDKAEKKGVQPWGIILIVLLLILLLALLIYIIKSRVQKEAIYALIYDKAGEYIGNTQIVLNTDNANIDLSDFEAELGNLVGVRVEIEQENAEKLVDYDIRVIDIAGQVIATKLITNEDIEQSVIIAIK